jgi:hypothetical protein
MQNKDKGKRRGRGREGRKTGEVSRDKRRRDEKIWKERKTVS